MQNDEPEFLEAYNILRNDGLTPLVTIKGFTDLLLRGAFGSISPQQEEAISTILQCSRDAIAVWHRATDYLRITYQEIPTGTVSADQFLSRVQEVETISQVEVTNTASSKDIICDMERIILALHYILLPPTRSLETAQKQNTKAILTFHTETLRIIVKVQRSQDITLQQIHWLQTHPGTSYHIATRIIQQHGGVLVVQAENDMLHFSFELPLI